MNICYKNLIQQTYLPSAIGFTYLEEGESEWKQKEWFRRNKVTTYWLKINDTEIAKLKITKPFARSAYGRISTVYLRKRSVFKSNTLRCCHNETYDTIRGVNAIWNKSLWSQEKIKSPQIILKYVHHLQNLFQNDLDSKKKMLKCTHRNRKTKL